MVEKTTKSSHGVRDNQFDLISDNQRSIKYDKSADLTLYRVHPESRTLPYYLINHYASS